MKTRMLALFLGLTACFSSISSAQEMTAAVIKESIPTAIAEPITGYLPEPTAIVPEIATPESIDPHEIANSAQTVPETISEDDASGLNAGISAPVTAKNAEQKPAFQPSNLNLQKCKNSRLYELAQKYFPENPDLFLAICKAESGLNPRAVHINRNGSVDRGLAQINSCHLGRVGNDPEKLFDLETNIRIARDIYLGAGRSFRPWTVYCTGLYRQHLNGNFALADAPRRDRRFSQNNQSKTESIKEETDPKKIDALIIKYFPENHRVMRAICIAESGFKPHAIHYNSNGTVDYGLAQINTCHIGKIFGQPFLLMDPELNLIVAREIYDKAKGFHPWVCYQNGEYKKYLSANVNLETVVTFYKVMEINPNDLLYPEGDQALPLKGTIPNIKSLLAYSPGDKPSARAGPHARLLPWTQGEEMPNSQSAKSYGLCSGKGQRKVSPTRSGPRSFPAETGDNARMPHKVPLTLFIGGPPGKASAE